MDELETDFDVYKAKSEEEVFSLLNTLGDVSAVITDQTITTSRHRFLSILYSDIEANPATSLEVDLEAQKAWISGKEANKQSFEIDEYKKMCIMNGYDDIDYLLSLKDEIASYEANRTYSFNV